MGHGTSVPRACQLQCARQPEPFRNLVAMGLARHLFFQKRKWEDLLWTPRDSALKGCSYSQQLAWELLQGPLPTGQLILRKSTNC